MQGRHLEQEILTKQHLAQEAARAKAKADTLPPGLERDLLLKKARQAETAAHLKEWADSPGLRPPS
ncbi:MAG TPA: hypothetical protein VJR30_13265 [Bradyrhizobium sp.]|nr:hypothetical protein [Bradyrhizobium sp.]